MVLPVMSPSLFIICVWIWTGNYFLGLDGGELVKIWRVGWGVELKRVCVVGLVWFGFGIWDLEFVGKD